MNMFWGKFCGTFRPDYIVNTHVVFRFVRVSSRLYVGGSFKCTVFQQFNSVTIPVVFAL